MEAGDSLTEHYFCARLRRASTAKVRLARFGRREYSTNHA
jgi:hypothetical protein